ncbi:ImmA/IrrE family metallo-endopeptidase [Acetivibrio sp. MSJd-27]|uniref:ImmA/IrrE family metallo-endopeptidase n=1 Tax=Acetivibrio sp. MSJd-27 TaxID=2841523 RepID=UPI001C1237AA|nr:ImmA/IrrE family metallo-endopeptidase [Acetivibrio sp. MSJd-27]MBU5451398.1 ImmA/IrrE family metallo-endopeptidase [Acetivibrio sp. MSJd-27]
MLEKQNREDIYFKTFKFIINNIDIYPLSVPQICKLLNVEMIKLSTIISETKISKEEIFSIWGNEDGTVQLYKKEEKEIYKILYNDSMCDGRIRFTLFEEFAHIILGHLKNYSEFSIFNQSYNDNLYKKLDEEARICAGLLLCPPQFFYKKTKKMSVALLAELFDLSYQCALSRYEILLKYQSEIQNCSLYSALPEIKFYRSNIRDVGLYKIKRDIYTGEPIAICF